MKTSSKKITIAAVAVAIVAAVALLVLYLTVWAEPSKQDFKDARSTATSIEDSYKDITNTYQKYVGSVKAGFMSDKSYKSVEADSAGAKSEYMEAVKVHQAAILKLEESKAAKDPEVEKAYNSFVTQDRKFIANSEGLLYSYARFTSSFETCADVFEVFKGTLPALIAKLHKEASQDCLVDLNALSSSKPGPLAEYGKKFASIVRDRQAVFDKTAKDQLSLEDSAKKISEIGVEYGKLDPASELSKAAKDSTLSNELKDLKSVLDRKASQ